MRGAASPSRRSDESETQVLLNVYDLTDINNYTTWFGFGVFHSGIQVHGKEYGFGAHDFPLSGVFEVEPRSCPGYTYRCSISLGRVNMPPEETRAFIEAMASEYHGDTYNLISKNCNHFSDDLSKRLVGKGIPRWVNRLAGLGAMCSCLLPESLQVTTVKSPEYHHGSEEGSSSWESSTENEIDEINSEQQLLPRAIIGEVTFVSDDNTGRRS